jgi:GGDEF domain-containing protein
MAALRLPIGTKFALMLAVLVPAIAAVALIGARGMQQLDAEITKVYATNIQITRHAYELGDNLDEAAHLSLVLIPTVSRSEHARLNAKLDALEPQVAGSIEVLRRSTAGFPEEQAQVQRIAAGWQQFLRLRRTGAFDRLGFGRASTLQRQRLGYRVSGIFDRVTATAAQISEGEVQESAESKAQAANVYRRNLILLLMITLATLVASVGSVLLLVRNVVPRIRRYSRFAGGVRSGISSERLDPRGSDELADLGRTLDEMVVRQTKEREQEALQTEFSQMMQLAETEDEAYHLLSRQLDRSISGAAAVVLNRNNSADRLEAASALPPDSNLEERLIAATPRSCLAVRFGRTHSEGPGRDPLVSCEVCGKNGDFSACEPLLVSGEVIGAALVQHPDPLTESEHNALTTSVNQAAPVLANLRNLALAEFRAATDSLTGLPNGRATRDTLKRMVAQASRMVSPLSALLLDLDHFKQINDSFGHGRGDDVLAAIGNVIPSVLRDGDFVVVTAGRNSSSCSLRRGATGRRS